MALTIKLGFQVDSKQLESTIGSMTKTLQRDIQNAASGASGLTQGVAKAAVQAGNFQKALERATTASGQISFSTLNKELLKAGTTVDKVVADLAAAGPAFEGSFRTVITSIASADRALISVSSRIKEMKRVMTQSVKFTLAQSIQRELVSAVRSSITWAKELDSDLTQIAVVSAKSATQMEKVYDTVLAKSKELKVAASDYAEAALIFYQQGLPDAEVERRSDITIKAAKAAGVATEEMSSQLTAIWNTYKMVGEEQERAASIGAKMAADTAVDFADIAEAMQSSASAAAQMGVSYNSLAAIIATVGDVTQQSASTIGNGYKTIFSRFEQLKSAGSDGEVTLNRVSAQLAELGISVLDSSGELRDLDAVINEVGEGWSNWTKKQQLAIAELVGGTRQYGQFLALMNNFDKYQKLRSEAEAEDGSTLEQQYSAALDSIDEKQARSVEAWRRAFRSVFDTDTMKGFYDGLTKIAEQAEDLVSTFGGMKGILLTLGSIFANDLTQKIATTGKQLKDSLIVSFTKNGAQKLVERDVGKVRERVDAGYDKAIQQQPNNPGLKIDKAEKNIQLDVIENTARRQQELNKIIREGSEAERQFAQMQKTVLDGVTANLLARSRDLAVLEGQVKKEEELLVLQEQRKSNISKEKESAQAELDKLKADKQFFEDYDSQTDWDSNDIYLDPEAYAQQERYMKIYAKIDDRSLNAQIQELEQRLKDLSDEEVRIDVALNTKKATERKKQLVQEMRSAMKGEIVDLREAEVVGRDSNGNYIIEENTENVEKMETAYNDLIQSIKEGNPELDNFAAAFEGAFGKANTDGLHELDYEVNNMTQVYESVIGKIHEYNASVDEGHRIVIPEDITNLSELGLTFDRFGHIVTQTSSHLDSFEGSAQKTIGAFVQFGTSLAQCISVFGNFVEKAKEGDVALGDGLAVITAIIPTIAALGSVVDALGIKAALAGDKAAIAWLKIVGPAAAAAVAIGAVVAAVILLNKYFNNFTPEGKLKKAQAAAEALATAEEEAAQKAENLRTAFDKYSTAEEKLNSCKRGTKEWADALKEANDAALELLNNLPSGMSGEEIKQFYEQDSETGRISINKDKVEEYQKFFDAEAAKASYANDIGQINAQRASNDLTRNNIAKDISLQNAYYDPKSQTVITQSVDEINSKIAEHLDELGSIIDQSEFKEALEDVGIQVGNLSETEIAALQSRFADLAKSAGAASEKFDVLSKIRADEILGDNYNGAEKNYAAAELKKETDELYKDYLGALTNGKMAQGKNDYKYDYIQQSDKEIDSRLLAEYNELTGNNYKSAKNGVVGNDAERFFVFWGEQQQKEVKLSAETVAQQMAAAKALESLGDSAKEARENLGKLEQAANNAKVAIEAREKSGDNSGATKKETQAIALSDAVTGYLANGNMNDITKSQLESLNGDDAKWLFNSLDPKLRAYFGEGEEAFTNYQNAIQSALSNITGAANSSAKSVQIAFADLSTNLGDISADTADTVVKILEDGFRVSGVEGMKAISDTIVGLGKNGAEEFQEIYDSINWANPDIGTLNKMLVEGEMSAEEAATAAEKLTNALKKQTEQTIESTQVDYAKGNEITDGLEQYDVISPEEIKELQEMGVATNHYFKILANGNSMLMADASQFKNIVNQINLGKMQEVANAAQDRYTTLAAYKDVDIANLDTEGRIDLLKALQPNNADLQTAVQEYYAANSRYDSATASLEQVKGDYNTAVTNGDTVTQNYYGAVAANLLNYLGQASLEAADAKRELDEIGQEANVSEELIANTLKETAADIAKAQEAISEANFQNAVEEYGLDLEETADYAGVLAEEFGYTESQAKKLAIANQRLDRGITDLNENMEDYKSILKDENKATVEYSKTLKSFKGSLADILNVNEDLISNDFAKNQLENSELLEAAISGDSEALAQLRKDVSVDIGDNIFDSLIQELAQATAEAKETQDGIFDSLVSQVAEAQNRLLVFGESWATLKDYINSGIGDMPVGEFVDSMNAMIAASQMTYEQVTSLLGSMGVDAEVETQVNKDTRSVPTTLEHREIAGYTDYEYPIGTGKDGKIKYAKGRSPYYKTYTTPGENVEAEGFFPTYSVKIKSGDTESGGNIREKKLSDVRAILPSPSPSPSVTTPAISTSPKSAPKPDQFKKAEYHQRYTDTKQKLDSVSKTLDKFNSASDDSIGPKKVANLQKVNALIAKQGQLYNKLYQEALAYVKADKIEMQKSLSTLGVTLKFNEDGTIANFEELQKKWEQKLNATDLNGNGILEESEEELYEQTKEHIEEQQKLVERYTEAVNEMNEALQNAVNNVREYMNNKLEEIKIAVEFDLKPTELAIRDLTRTIDILGEVGLKTGKVFDKMSQQMFAEFQKFSIMGESATQKLDIIKRLREGTLDESKIVEIVKEFGYEDIESFKAYLEQNGGLPAEYMDSLAEDIDSINDSIENSYNLLESVYDSYSELFELFLKDFERINAGLDTNVAKLQLFEKLYEATGNQSTQRKEDEALIVTGKRNNAEAKYSTVRAERDALRNEQARRQKMADDILQGRGLDELSEREIVQYNKIKAILDDVTDRLADAEQEVISALSNAIDAAIEEAEKNVEVARAKFAESVTKEMFNDLDSFDKYYQDLQAKQEFYLDQYDKYYNLDKFNYQIDDYLQDADIGNSERLKAWENFQKRINDLRREGVELTQSQIDKLQAEFELEKLKDQYEQAQNAKSTMRLTRDASGNYNYVYSQNSSVEDINDIGQKIKDKAKEIRDMNKAIIKEMSDNYVASSKEFEDYITNNIEKIRQSMDENGRITDAQFLLYKENLRRQRDQIIEACNDSNIKFEETSLGIISHTNDMGECHQKFTESFRVLVDEQIESSKALQEQIDKDTEAEGIDYDDLLTAVKTAVGNENFGIIGEDAAAGKASWKLADDINNSMSKAAGSVGAYSAQICGYIDAMILKYQQLKIEMDRLQYGNSGYDENTDYSSFLYSKWRQDGGSVEDFLKKNMNLVTERWNAKIDRYGESEAGSLEDVLNETLSLLIKWAGEGKEITSWDFGTGRSTKYLDYNTGLDYSADLYNKWLDSGKYDIDKFFLDNITEVQERWSAAAARDIYVGDSINEMIARMKELFEQWAQEGTGKLNTKYAYAAGGLADFTGPAWLDGTKSRPELVLNPDDTENILAAVREIRFSVVSRQIALNNVSTTGGYQAFDKETTPVLQDIKIDATFPNVSVADEIEEAFEDLINKTSQYAAKK